MFYVFLERLRRKFLAFLYPIGEFGGRYGRVRWARDSVWILVYIFSRYVWEWGVMERTSHLFTLPFLLDYPILLKFGCRAHVILIIQQTSWDLHTCFWRNIHPTNNAA